VCSNPTCLCVFLTRKKIEKSVKILKIHEKSNLLIDNTRPRGHTVVGVHFDLVVGLSRAEFLILKYEIQIICDPQT
ncbi:hypothetical protein ES332_D10G215700v1, partial [Gossypium tomentosum]